MIGEWKAILYDKSDNPIADLPFQSIEIEEKLNGIPTARLTVEYSILKNILEQYDTVENTLFTGFRWVEIYREESGTTFKYFAGLFSEASLASNDQNVSITMTFRGWLHYFSKRYTSKKYTNSNDGFIAWDMINQAQLESNGDIGITQGANTTIHSSDLSNDLDDIAKQVIHLSSEKTRDGYEFEVTNEKVLNTLTRIGSDKPDIVFDESNIKSYEVNYLIGTELANKVHVLGEGMGEEQIRTVKEADTSFQSKWYLLEKVLSYTDVSFLSTLENYAEQELIKKRDYSRQVTITSANTLGFDLTGYGVGDGVKIEIPGIISETRRIFKKMTSVQQGVEQVFIEFLYY